MRLSWNLYERAIKWLNDQGVEFESIDIVSAPPSASLLKKVLKLSGGEIPAPSPRDDQTGAED